MLRRILLVSDLILAPRRHVVLDPALRILDTSSQSDNVTNDVGNDSGDLSDSGEVGRADKGKGKAVASGALSLSLYCPLLMIMQARIICGAVARARRYMLTLMMNFRAAQMTICILMICLHGLIMSCVVTLATRQALMECGSELRTQSSQTRVVSVLWVVPSANARSPRLVLSTFLRRPLSLLLLFASVAVKVLIMSISLQNLVLNTCIDRYYHGTHA